MSLIRQFAIRNELLYSGFVLPNVQIFFVQKISFATFGVSIDDFFTRYAGLGYSLIPLFTCIRLNTKFVTLDNGSDFKCLYCVTPSSLISDLQCT